MPEVLVIGSVCADEVVCLSERLQAGRHVEGQSRGRRLGGGAANTGLALRRADHAVAIAAALGDDECGDWLLDQLAVARIDTSLVVRVAGSSTRSLILLEPDGERTVVNTHRCRAPVDLRGREPAAVYVRSRTHEPQLTALLDAQVRRALVVAHVPPLEAGSRPAQVLLGSEADLPGAFLNDPWRRGRDVAGAWLEWVVVTRGPAGAVAHGEHDSLCAPAPRLVASDTTGAGDAFAAGLVHALLAGQAMPEALSTAVEWGSGAIQRANA